MIAKFDFVFHIREKALGSVSMILRFAQNDRAAMEVSQFSRNIRGNSPFNAAEPFDYCLNQDFQD